MSDRARIISVIPVYNGKRFIRATLDSLAAQTLRPDRVIVLAGPAVVDQPAAALEYAARLAMLAREVKGEVLVVMRAEVLL